MTTDEKITGISNFWSANTSFFLTYCFTDLFPEIYYFSSFVVLLVLASRKLATMLVAIDTDLDFLNKTIH